MNLVHRGGSADRGGKPVEYFRAVAGKKTSGLAFMTKEGAVGEVALWRPIIEGLANSVLFLTGGYDLLLIPVAHVQQLGFPRNGPTLSNGQLEKMAASPAPRRSMLEPLGISTDCTND